MYWILVNELTSLTYERGTLGCVIDELMLEESHPMYDPFCTCVTLPCISSKKRQMRYLPLNFLYLMKIAHLDIFVFIKWEWSFLLWEVSQLFFH